jgi:adenylate cyclase, class 2
MLEVEVKYSVNDFGPLEAALAHWGAALGPPRRDSDHYFNAPDRDFARTDEAFRVRSVGASNFVTYKGPKRDRETKTRLEIEVALADGEEAAADFRRMLTLLGYKPSGIVRKSRRVARCERHGFPLQVCLDEVDHLGRFAELEVVAAEEHYEAAKALVLAAAGELGLTRVERRSYLEMVLAQTSGDQSRP